MIQETSLEAYKYALTKINANQTLILHFIRKQNGITNLMLSRIMDRPINTITPRVKELRNLGLVQPAGYVIDPVTRRRAILWVAAYPKELV